MLLLTPLTSEVMTTLVIVINSLLLYLMLTSPVTALVLIVEHSVCIVCDSDNNTHSNNSE